MAVLIRGLVQASAVNLTHLAGVFGGPARLSSNDRRLQRFFQYVRLDADWLAHLRNVHFTVMFSHAYWKGIPNPKAKALDVEMPIHDVAARHGGTISAEHGIGRKLATELERLGDPVRLAIMRDVRRALDPANLMNPSALFA